MPAPASARKVVIDFKVDPADAKVNCQYGFLGHANEPVTLDLDEFGAGAVELRFESEGYETLTSQVSAEFSFPNSRNTYPLSGVISLKPTTPLTYFKRHLGLFLILGIPAAILCALGWHFVRKSRAALGKVERFEELVAMNDLTGIASSVIGDWQIVRELGGGGMARVYQAVPKASMRDSQAVALKIIQSELAGDKEFDERFRREIKVCQSLDHKNIVRLYDYGEVEGRKFLVMELVRGTTLRARLRKGGMAPREMLRYVEPLFSAVSYAHEHGVVHRDLKPENMMLTEEDELKVLDFGLARRVTESDRLTQTGVSLGTPVYMSPEQIRHSTFEPATDQYALGVIVYEMLVGHPPFQSDDPMQVLFLHISDFAPAPSQMRAGVPHEIDRVMLRMLAKSARERYPTVQEAGQELIAALRAWGKE